jgi:trigger factor
MIDYQGRAMDSEAEEVIEGVEGTDFQVELEEGRFIEGFVPGIVGMNIGETKEVSVTFPEDYGREDLAGEPVIFTITLKELKEKELPELDDDFAQEVSESEFETMAEFRESLENQFKEKAENETKANIQEALVSELVKVSEVDLPETMVEQELQNILTQTAMQLSQYGMDINTIFTRENIPALKARSRPEAIERLKQSLTLTEVAEVESLAPTDEEIETRYQEMLKQLEGREVDTDKLRALVTDDLQREKALDLMQEHANVELVPEGSLEVEETEATEAEAEQTPVSEATVEVEAATEAEEMAQ